MKDRTFVEALHDAGLLNGDVLVERAGRVHRAHALVVDRTVALARAITQRPSASP